MSMYVTESGHQSTCGALSEIAPALRQLCARSVVGLPLNQMKKLTNSHHDFHMINLSWGSGGKGPYLVRQVGYVPSDETLTDKPFMLQKDGSWILTYHIACLPEDEQEKRLFSSIDEMFAVIDQIGIQEVVVIDCLPEGVTDEEALRRYKSSMTRMLQRMRESKAEAILR